MRNEDASHSPHAWLYLECDCRLRRMIAATFMVQGRLQISPNSRKFDRRFLHPRSVANDEENFAYCSRVSFPVPHVRACGPIFCVVYRH